jgi:transposase
MAERGAAGCGLPLRVNALLRPIDALDPEITASPDHYERPSPTTPVTRAAQIVPGNVPTLAAIFVAEIGDVTHLASPAYLSSWPG